MPAPPAALLATLTPFERAFYRQCVQGPEIRFDGREHALPGTEPVLRPRLVAWALTDQHVAERLGSRTIRMRNVRIGHPSEQGTLVLDRREVLLMVRFKNITFEQGLSMRHARARDFSLVGCYLGTYTSTAGRYRARDEATRQHDRHRSPLHPHVSLDAYGSRLAGRFVFAAASGSPAQAEGVVNLGKVVTQGFINMRGAELQGYPVSLDLSGIEARSVFLSRGFRAHGSVYALACKVHDVFSAEAGEFGLLHDQEPPPSPAVPAPEGLAPVTPNPTPAVSPEHATSGPSQPSAPPPSSPPPFAGPFAGDRLPPQRIALTLRYATIGGLLQFTEGFVAKGTVDLKEARVRGPLDLWGATFYMPRGVALLGHNLRVDGDLVCTRPPNLGMSWYDHERVRSAARFYGEVTFANAEVGGEVDFARALMQAPPHGGALAAPIALSFYRARVGGRMRLGRGFRADGLIALEEARISGSLDLQGGWFLNPRGLAIAANRIDVGGDVLMARKWRRRDLYSRVGEQDEAPVHPEDWPTLTADRAHDPTGAPHHNRESGDDLEQHLLDWTSFWGALTPRGNLLDVLLRRLADAFQHPQRYGAPPLLVPQDLGGRSLKTDLRHRHRVTDAASKLLRTTQLDEATAVWTLDNAERLAALLWAFLEAHRPQDSERNTAPEAPPRASSATLESVPDATEQEPYRNWDGPLRAFRLLERRFIALGMVSFKAARIRGDLDLSGGLYVAVQRLPPEAPRPEAHQPSAGLLPSRDALRRAARHQAAVDLRERQSLEWAIETRARKTLSKWIAIDVSHATIGHALYLTRWVPSSPATLEFGSLMEGTGGPPSSYAQEVYPLRVSGLLDLSASQAEQVHIDPRLFREPTDGYGTTSELLMEGFTYTSIFDDVAELARCDWFYRGAGSTAQPNEQLAAALRRQGHHDESRRALLRHRSVKLWHQRFERGLLRVVHTLFPWQHAAFALGVAFLIGTILSVGVIRSGGITVPRPPVASAVAGALPTSLPSDPRPPSPLSALERASALHDVDAVLLESVPSAEARVVQSDSAQRTTARPESPPRLTERPIDAVGTDSVSVTLDHIAAFAHTLVLGARYAACALLPLLPMPAGWEEVSWFANVLSLGLGLVGLVLVSSFVVGIAGVFRKP